MPNTITLIASTTVTATPVTVITFTSIPQTYTDLMIVTSCRTTDTGGTSNYASDVLVTFNSTGSGYQNYFSRNLSGSLNAFTGGTTAAAGLLGSGKNATASTFAGAQMYIPNYTTSLNKNFYAYSAIESNNANYDSSNVSVGGTWNNSAAITRIDCTDGYGGYAVGSMINIYGIIKS